MLLILSSWKPLDHQQSMIQMSNSINWKPKSATGVTVRTFDDKLQVIPDLILHPLADTLPEEQEEDRQIIETLERDYVIFAPRCTRSNRKISRITAFSEIPDLPNCKSWSLT